MESAEGFKGRGTTRYPFDEIQDNELKEMEEDKEVTVTGHRREMMAVRMRWGSQGDGGLGIDKGTQPHPLIKHGLWLLSWTSRVGESETVWPAKPKMFIRWLFAEKCLLTQVESLMVQDFPDWREIPEFLLTTAGTPNFF